MPNNDHFDESDDNKYNALWKHYDESIVHECLSQLEKTSKTDILLALMHGRGAEKNWKLPEHLLKRDLSFDKIPTFFREIPFTKIVSLVDDLAPSNNEIIERITAAQVIGGLKLLPTVRLEEIVSTVAELLYSNLPNEAAVLKEIIRNPLFHKDARIFEFASNWCLSRAGQRQMIPVLSELLQLKCDFRLISLAEEYLQKCSWTKKDSLLLVSLMRAQGKRIDTKLIYACMQTSDEDQQLEPYVLSMWFYNTGSREAFKNLRNGIEWQPRRYQNAFWTLASYSNRKIVRRWTHRYLSYYIRYPLVHSILYYQFLSVSFYNVKYAHKLAEQAVEFANGEDKDDLVTSLVSYGRKTNNSKVMQLARQLVAAYPDAPRSFNIMCSLAKADPEFGIPWLFEWCKTARPSQIMSGMDAILKASPNELQRKQAQEWQKRLIEEDLVPLSQQVKYYIFQLKHNRNEDVVRLAEALLEKTAAYSHLGAIVRLKAALKK